MSGMPDPVVAEYQKLYVLVIATTDFAESCFRRHKNKLA